MKRETQTEIKEFARGDSVGKLKVLEVKPSSYSKYSTLSTILFHYDCLNNNFF